MGRQQGERKDGRLALYAAFTNAALRYWVLVFPRVARELRKHRKTAQAMQPAARQALVAQALAKRSNIEGAAACATFVPRAHRKTVIRALVAFQSIYNYTDLLAEQPDPDPVTRARRLHAGLLAALDSGDGAAAHREGGADAEDAFLAQEIRACRAAFLELPSCAVVAPLARAAAERIVTFQSLSMGNAGELERWAKAAGEGLSDPGRGSAPGSVPWWETAAAAGSSLAVFALIAAGGSPGLAEIEAQRIHDVYAPGICALHSLLDSLIDQAEDAESGQLSLIRCYPSPGQATDRLVELARQAVASTAELPRPRAHLMLVTAMVCNYLADLTVIATAPAGASDSRFLVRRLCRALGPAAAPVLIVFRLRRLLGRRRSPWSLAPSPEAVAATRAPLASTPADPDAQGANARAT